MVSCCAKPVTLRPHIPVVVSSLWPLTFCLSLRWEVVAMWGGDGYAIEVRAVRCQIFPSCVHELWGNYSMGWDASSLPLFRRRSKGNLITSTSIAIRITQIVLRDQLIRRPLTYSTRGRDLLFHQQLEQSRNGRSRCTLYNNTVPFWMWPVLKPGRKET